MRKKRSESSRREWRLAASALFTKPLTKAQRSELERLRDLPEAQIDRSETPEVNTATKAVIGRFYRPVKKLVSFRVDADVLEWFRSKGDGYQTRMNAVLRREMDRRSGESHGSGSPSPLVAKTLR